MHLRQNLIETFSTFLQFKSDQFGGWITDPKLKRSMEQSLQKGGQEWSESFWVLYWHKVWQTQTNSLAEGHIAAYLQEVCFWVARKISLNLASRFSVADLFQTAIARIRHVLKGFNPQLSSNLKSYAEFTFGNIIKDTLRKNQEADICSDWALLQKVSQKRLVEALGNAGLNNPAIARYVLVWSCFKELYASTEVRNTRKLIKPDATTLASIAELYNHLQKTQPASLQEASTPEKVDKWLTTCARAVRTFLYPQPISTDAPSNSTDEAIPLLDRLPGEQDSLLHELLIQEDVTQRQSTQAQLRTVLAEAIATLDSPAQQLLEAYYRQDMTQQQIAEQLQIKQYTVSRQLNRVRKMLLKTIAEWSQETLHISLTLDVLESMSAVLDEWLNTHYHPSNFS